MRRSAELAFPPRVDRPVPEFQQDDLREVHERPFRSIFLVSSGRIDIVGECGIF
jgi:hypothetical protein